MRNDNLYVLIILFILFISCSKNEINKTKESNYQEDLLLSEDSNGNFDCDEVTHIERGKFNYSIIFNQKSVNRIDKINNSLTQTYLKTNISYASNRPDFRTNISNDIIWHHIATLYKSNPNSQIINRKGNTMLSLKFDFNQFDDKYPIIKIKSAFDIDKSLKYLSASIL